MVGSRRGTTTPVRAATTRFRITADFRCCREARGDEHERCQRGELGNGAFELSDAARDLEGRDEADGKPGPAVACARGRCREEIFVPMRESKAEVERTVLAVGARITWADLDNAPHAVRLLRLFVVGSPSPTVTQHDEEPLVTALALASDAGNWALVFYGRAVERAVLRLAVQPAGVTFSAPTASSVGLVSRRDRHVVGRVLGTAHRRVPIDEHPVWVVSPRPHMQLVERRKAVAVGGSHEVELLSHEHWGSGIGRMPRFGEDEELDPYQPESSVSLFVDQELGILRIERWVADQCAVCEVNPHGPLLRSADTATCRTVAGGECPAQVAVILRSGTYFADEARWNAAVVALAV